MSFAIYIYPISNGISTLTLHPHSHDFQIIKEVITIYTYVLTINKCTSFSSFGSYFIITVWVLLRKVHGKLNKIEYLTLKTALKILSIQILKKIFLKGRCHKHIKFSVVIIMKPSQFPSMNSYVRSHRVLSIDSLYKHFLHTYYVLGTVFRSRNWTKQESMM